MAFVGNGGSASPLNASQIPDLSATYDTAAAETTRNTFSTAEVDTGQKWIDGKTIYRKVVNLGAMPNATTKLVAHGIAGIFNVVRLYGVASNSSYIVPLPHAVSSSIANQIHLLIDGSNISVGAGIDRSSLFGYAVIEYTKG